MANSKKGCFRRIWCVLQIAIHILDIFTDISTLMVYWKTQSTTVFVLALFSIAVSIPVGIAYYLYQFRLCMGKIDTEKPIITLKLIGILAESLPQLLINLYILSSCNASVKSVQWISAAISFLAICVAIVHYDVSVRVHNDIGFVQKILILLYRSTYLAARILAIVYFVYTLQWWGAVVMVIHWIIGLCCLMKNEVETLARSLVYIFLNTFVYIGDFTAVTALFVLILYVLENLVMTAAAYIVRSTYTSQSPLLTTESPSIIELTPTVMQFQNDFLPPEQQNDATVIDQSSPPLPPICFRFDSLAAHIGLNVIAVAICCVYNVSFHYTACSNQESGQSKPDAAENMIMEDLQEPMRLENEA